MHTGRGTNVFVYGTLKPGGCHHEQYCGRFTFKVRNARIKGRLFNFPRLGYPGACEAKNSWIRGCLITFFHPEKEVLPTLDELEGFDASRPRHLNEYYRITVDAHALENGPASERAWCYFMELNLINQWGGIPLKCGHWPG